MSGLLKILFVSLILPCTAFAELSAFCDIDPSKDYIEEGTANTDVLKEICNLEREHSAKLRSLRQSVKYEVLISASTYDLKDIEKTIFSIKPDARITLHRKYNYYVITAFENEAYEMAFTLQNQKIDVNIEMIGAGVRPVHH